MTCSNPSFYFAHTKEVIWEVLEDLHTHPYRRRHDIGYFGFLQKDRFSHIATKPTEFGNRAYNG